MTAAAGNKNSFTRLIAVVLTGILAGLSGMVLALILHAIQHLAFGYSPGQIVSAESFLQGVTDSSWPRRISAIVAGGAIAGFGWWRWALRVVAAWLPGKWARWGRGWWRVSWG